MLANRVLFQRRVCGCVLCHRIAGSLSHTFLSSSSIISFYAVRQTHPPTHGQIRQRGYSVQVINRNLESLLDIYLLSHILQSMFILFARNIPRNNVHVRVSITATVVNQRSRAHSHAVRYSQCHYLSPLFNAMK